LSKTLTSAQVRLSGRRSREAMQLPHACAPALKTARGRGRKPPSGPKPTAAARRHTSLHYRSRKLSPSRCAPSSHLCQTFTVSHSVAPSALPSCCYPYATVVSPCGPPYLTLFFFPSTQVLPRRCLKPSRATPLRSRGHQSCVAAVPLQTIAESVAEAIHVDGSLRPFPSPTSTSPRTASTPATSPTSRPHSSAASPARRRRAPPPLLRHRGQGLSVSHSSSRCLNRVPHEAVLP
jgi:hypothetical protein